MKNKINNKLLLLTTLSAIVMSGCVEKTIAVSPNKINNVEKSNWKVSNIKKSFKDQDDDCIDCYANFPKASAQKIAFSEKSQSIYSNDYSQAPIKRKVIKQYKNPYEENNAYPVDTSYSEENSYLVDASYKEDEHEYQTAHTNKSQINLNKKSIQVGAFRKYAGAKVYAKRYSLLTTKYNVDIKKNVNNGKPLYRVQIEGFSNEFEAKKFMERYGLHGAFLVRR